MRHARGSRAVDTGRQAGVFVGMAGRTSGGGKACRVWEVSLDRIWASAVSVTGNTRAL